MQVAFLLFGVKLWAARLPVALATVGLAWVAGRLARDEVGSDAEPVAILFTGTMLGVLRYGRLAMQDVRQEGGRRSARLAPPQSAVAAHRGPRPGR